MSGRLIITTKKTYCPWNQQNVERVLRDERLERERIERETVAEKSAALAKRRGEPDNLESESSRTLTRHINLFPEAEEAELRLAQGIGFGASTTTKNAEKKDGIMPVPLGGEEASNRKSGHLPFYLQSHQSATSDSNISNTDRVLGRKVKGDAITGQIMRDQAVCRDESRKLKMDPMVRFYTNGDCKAAAATGGGGLMSSNNVVRPLPKLEDHGNIEAEIPTSQIDTAKNGRKSSKKGRMKAKRKISRQDRYEDDCSDASSRLLSTSSKRHSKKRKSKEKRRSRQHRNDRRRDIDSSSSSDDDEMNSASKSKHSSLNDDDDALQHLRKKRLEREAREKQRQKDMLDTDDTRDKFANDRDRGYQDQWNPMLSRK